MKYGKLYEMLALAFDAGWGARGDQIGTSEKERTPEYWKRREDYVHRELDLYLRDHEVS